MSTPADAPAAHLDRARTQLAALQTASCALVALFATVLYYPTLVRLIDYWAENDTYSYAFIVPFISAGFVWARRGDLRRAPVAPSLIAGGTLLALGLAALLAGRLSSTNLIEEVSIIPTIAGLVLLVFGPAVFRVIWFAIVYLCAMIPFWDRLTTAVHPVFQSWSAWFGVTVVRLLGIPAVQDGVIIRLPNISLEVAQACSGVNYLIAVLCIGLPVAQLFVRRWPKRALILLMSVVIALLSNGLRVAVVSLFAYYGIRGANGDVHGPFALFRSLLVSGVGFAAVLGLAIRFADRDHMELQSVTVASDRHVTSSRSRVPAAGLVAAVLLMSCGAYLTTHQVVAVPLGGGFLGIPTTISGWRLTSTPVIASDLDPSIFDDHLVRNYMAPDGTEANLFVGYYSAQVHGRELAGYSLRQALSGEDGGVFGLTDGASARDFLVTDGSERFHVTYWYLLNGRMLSDDVETKLDIAWQSFALRRTNAAVIAVKARSRPGESVEVARLRERGFVSGVAAAVKSTFPR